jgi:hypothetical protein
MARLLCDICGVHPATIRLAVLQNNQRRVLDVCDFHYAQPTRHQRSISPLEALFRAQGADAGPSAREPGKGGGAASTVARSIGSPPGYVGYVGYVGYEEGGRRPNACGADGTA